MLNLQTGELYTWRFYTACIDDSIFTNFFASYNTLQVKKSLQITFHKIFCGLGVDKIKGMSFMNKRQVKLDFHSPSRTFYLLAFLFLTATLVSYFSDQLLVYMQSSCSCDNDIRQFLSLIFLVLKAASEVCNQSYYRIKCACLFASFFSSTILMRLVW